jgi:cycloartenol synthase
MIDYTYVECTSASVQALRMFARRHPEHRTEQVAKAISDGVHFILRVQRPDGSWYGSWGVCFTYGAWFGLSGLAAAGVSYNGNHAIKRGVAFLLERQNPDGGWGESYLACQDKVYSPLPDGESHAVNTAWALLALLASGQAGRDAAPLHAAARCLLRSQMPAGDWPQQHISGVFNRNCMVRGNPSLRTRTHAQLTRALLVRRVMTDHVCELPQHLPAVGAGRILRQSG